MSERSSHCLASAREGVVTFTFRGWMLCYEESSEGGKIYTYEYVSIIVVDIKIYNYIYVVD